MALKINVFKVFVSFLVLHLYFVCGDEHTHVYKSNEEVVLWINTIGPYNNLQETYTYFNLPICAGRKYSTSYNHERLNEALQGVKLVYSGLDIHFKDNISKVLYCIEDLNYEKLKAFEYAVRNHYWYKMYIDDLPIWGIVGEVDEINNKYYIWTHKKFDIGYNGYHIVDVNLTSEAKVELKVNTNIEFTYEINWKPSPIIFKDRFNKYLDPKFFQHRIHWFSTFSRFVTVILLVGLVSIILLRTVREDYVRYSQDKKVYAIDKDFNNEYGWKQVHGDVFRPASYPMFFSSIIGCGHHITLVTLIVITITIIGDFYTERVSLLGTSIFVYTVTSPINGYFGASLYSKMGGRIWIRQILLSAFLLPSLGCGIAFIINFIATYYDEIHVISFRSMTLVARICVFVILPLTLVGTLLGRNLSGQPNYPYRVNDVPRPIPAKKWCMEPLIITMLCGILPFGSIFIEMDIIFTSFWAYKIYYVYWLMLLVVLILMAVTVCVTIVCTYFLLNAEDYRWQWTSLAPAASTAIYVYLYSFYYFMFNMKMYGLFQIAFYFGYMALFSIALGIMCGTVGYIGANAFVRKIYTTVKMY